MPTKCFLVLRDPSNCCPSVARNTEGIAFACVPTTDGIALIGACFIALRLLKICVACKLRPPFAWYAYCLARTVPQGTSTSNNSFAGRYALA